MEEIQPKECYIFGIGTIHVSSVKYGYYMSFHVTMRDIQMISRYVNKFNFPNFVKSSQTYPIINVELSLHKTKISNV